MNPRWVPDGYDEIRLRIFRRLLRREWPSARAEDMATEATQEAVSRNFTRTHESYAHFLNSTTLIAWRYVQDELPRRNSVSLPTDPPHPEPPAPGLADDIKACLAELAPHLRDVFVRRFTNEERAEDIAVDIGVSVSGVFRRLEAARGCLEACMVRKGWNSGM